MSEMKRTDAAINPASLEDAANAAAELEAEAKAEPDTGVYTHDLKAPFSHEGRTYEVLRFDWASLTGADSLAIEANMRQHGQNLVIPAFTGEYLTEMAARACTERDGNGRRVVSMGTIKALPLRDFQAICNHARAFLLKSES